MLRDPFKLKSKKYDMLVIGGGIHGAFVAWDAALRGLTVALIERDDFGGATSANSLKTVHGGLRYLQDGDLKLVRKMIRERRAYLRIAPHLVHPLPCVMPTYRQLKKNKYLLTPALYINDLIGSDRNQGQDPAACLPQSRPLSRRELLAKLQGIKPDGITGGVSWYDGQIYNSERFLLSILESAVSIGADVVNYLKATELIYEAGTAVVGAKVEDCLTGDRFNISADLVVNATGAWTDHLINNGSERSRFNNSTAINIITRKFIDDVGAGIFGQYLDEVKQESKSRLLFISPWRNSSIIGTIHEHFVGDPSEHVVSTEQVQAVLDEVNDAYPGARLTLGDVRFVHRGFLPTTAERDGDVKLVRKGQVHDHLQEDGVSGLVSVVGVKYTTAREVAERAVDLSESKLRASVSKCQTDRTRVIGAEFESLDQLLHEAAQNEKYDLSTEAAAELVYNYGSRYSSVLDELDQDIDYSAHSIEERLVVAQIRLAIRNEMAIKLTDVVLRRTELGSAGYPGDQMLKFCAEVMGEELGWDWPRTQAEIAMVKAIYHQCLMV